MRIEEADTRILRAVAG